MLVVVRLAERLRRREQIDAILEDARRHQLDVRRDADFLDRHVAWRQVLRDGQLERALVRRVLLLEIVQDLDGSLSEALPSDDDRAVQVLQRAGDDFRGARALRADQHGHGELALAAVVACQLRLAQLTVHPDGGHDGAFLHERIADLDGLLEQSARIAAHVEDQSAHCPAVLLAHRADRRLHVARRRPREAGEPHVADSVVEQLGGDRLVRHGGADEIELARVLALVLHDDGDARARLPAHAIDGFLQLHRDGRVGIDLRDDVALLDARAPRRRVLQHFADGEAVVDHRDDEPEPAEFASRLDFHLLVEVGLQEPAVRVERGEHPVDGGVLDLALIALGNEVVPDEGEHLPHLQRDLPDRVDVPVIEFARGVADRDADLTLGEARVRVATIGRRIRRGSARLTARSLVGAVRATDLDHYFRHLTLHRLESGGKHLLRADAGGIDVVVLDLDDRLPQHLEARQVVVAVLRIDCRDRIGRSQRPRRAVARNAGERQKDCNREGGEAERGLRSHWDLCPGRRGGE